MGLKASETNYWKIDRQWSNRDLSGSILPYMETTQPTDPPKWSECASIYSLMDSSGKILGTVSPIKDPYANWFMHFRSADGTLQPYGGYVGITEAMMICEIELGLRPNTLFTPILKEMEAFEQEWRDILDKVLVLPKGDYDPTRKD